MLIVMSIFGSVTSLWTPFSVYWSVGLFVGLWNVGIKMQGSYTSWLLSEHFYPLIFTHFLSLFIHVYCLGLSNIQPGPINWLPLAGHTSGTDANYDKVSKCIWSFLRLFYLCLEENANAQARVQNFFEGRSVSCAPPPSLFTPPEKDFKVFKLYKLRGWA